MADPRGLSGAVFQPTQLRDFTQDLLVSDQYKAKKEAAAQKQIKEDLEEYNTGTINNGYHIQAVEKSIIPKIKELTLLRAEAKQNGDRDAEMKYTRQLTGVTNNFKGLVKQLNRFDKFANDNYDNLQTAVSEGYAGEEFINSVNQMNILNNEGIRDAEIEIDENGDIFFNGVPQGELLRPQIFKSEKPYDLQEDIIKGYTKRTEDGQWDKQASAQSIDDGAGTPKQQRQFYTFLKQRKGYDEDTIKSALSRPENAERLKNEFYEYALRQIENAQSETSRAEKESGGSGDAKSLTDISEVFTLEDKKAIKLRPRAIYFDTVESMDVKDPNDEEKMIKKPFGVNANLINYAVDSNGDIIGTFVYYTSNGISERKSRKLSNEDIASIETNLPEGETLKSFYQKKVGASSTEDKKPKAETKKSEVYTFQGNDYTIEEIRAQYGEDFNPLEYADFKLKK